MIDKQYKQIVFVCDNCQNGLETKDEDFWAAFDVLKDANWKAIKENNIWKHYCSECRSDGGFKNK